jgi:hypothetical protein
MKKIFKPGFEKDIWQWNFAAYFQLYFSLLWNLLIPLDSGNEYSRYSDVLVYVKIISSSKKTWLEKACFTLTKVFINNFVHSINNI